MKNASKKIFSNLLPRTIPCVQRLPSFFIFSAVALILAGCGSGTQVSPATSADRSSREVRPNEKPSAPTVGEIFRGARSDANGSSAKAPSAEARLEAFRDQIGEETDPKATAQILYEALSDPEPKIQEEAAKWLRLLAEQDEEARGKIKDLQGKEHRQDVWHRAADALAPREIPEETVLPEQTDEENG